MMKLIAIMYVVINNGLAPIYTIEVPGTYKDCTTAVAASKATFIPAAYPNGSTATELRLGFLCLPAK